MRWNKCSRGAALSSVKKCLPREQKQHHRQDVNPVLENPPGETKPLAIAGEGPGEHAAGQRDGERQTDQPEDSEHLGVLGGEANHARRRFLRALEHDFLHHGRVGEDGAQQLVVQRMSRLVRAVGGEQRLADEV